MILLNKLFPYACLLCRKTSNTALCSECVKELPWLGSACPICAAPLATDAICGQCQLRKPLFDRTICLARYQLPVSYLIKQFKFHQGLAYGRACSQLLTAKLQEYYRHHTLPEVIIPIPLAKARLRQRGFNQAVELAKPIGKQLHIPLDYKSCLRTRNTLPQTDIAAKARKQNVSDVFAMHNKNHYTHVALIDDVMTTGHTVNECSRVLRQTGIQTIDVWCIARTNHA